jgi:hypothetical protein
MTRLINVVYLVLGFMIGYSTNTLLHGTGAVPSNTTKADNPVQLQKQEAVYQQQFQQKIDSLSSENTVLRVQVSKTGQALNRTKRTNAELEEQVTALITNRYSTTDTAIMLANCDTLEQTVQLLISNNNEKDSLYEQAMFGLEMQVAVKDSMLSIQEEQIQSVQCAFDKSIQQQQVLLSENKAYMKTEKRQKVKRRLLSAGAMILSGFAAYSLLR